MNVYEYKNKNNLYTSYIHKNNITLNKEKGIYSMTQSSKRVFSSLTNYLAFEFKPNYNISHLLVKIDISGGIYELSTNTSKIIIKLKSDDDYFFFIQAKRFNFIRFTLTLKNDINQTKNPFSYINSLESYDKVLNGYNYKNPLISPIINEDKRIITITQYISDSESTKYIYFKIRPSYYIDYMLADVDITDCFIDLDNYNYSKGIYSLKRN